MTRDRFYEDLPRTSGFAELAAGEGFVPLPDDWMAGCTDIVDSTGLIAAGRYKTVNMIGASVISALINRLDAPFPFVFGGDGASFAVPADAAGAAQQVLAQLRAWVAAEFGIGLRAALLPVSQARAAGFEVSVARYSASKGVDYAMFSGGGMAWAEQQMKEGRNLIAPSGAGGAPDLTGLSCRWSNAKSRNGTILSLVVLPAGRSGRGFEDTAQQITGLAARLDRSGHPLPQAGPPAAFPPPGLRDEARLVRRGLPYLLNRLSLLAESAFATFLFTTGRRFRGFDPAAYRQELSANTDFRKFDDGLKMTLDCPPDICARIKSVLQEAAAAGHIRYGLHEQDEAMVTCIVPSLKRNDHMHFVDGAAGGYTMAAARLRSAEAG